MDLLAQHEAFLRAIFDAPDDDTPRLVYADFLQENGEEDRAEFIRWQCGYGEKPKLLPPLFEATGNFERGFPPPLPRAFPLNYLLDRDLLRREAVFDSPEFFGLERIKIGSGRIATSEPFDTLFGLVAFARVTALDLEGASVYEDTYGDVALATFRIVPVITTAGVEALVRHRGVRRITSLDLRNNDLDNDAARALVNSPYLNNLKRLQLLGGNRFRGKVWQQVIERFGEDVVG